MKTKKIALFAYITCCILSVFGDMLKLDSLVLFTLPLVIPSIFFYYFSQTKKIDLLVCLYLIFSFLGDYIGLMDFDNELNYIMFPFFICNIAIILIMIKNLSKFKFNIFNILSISVFAIFLLYFWYLVVELFSFSEGTIKSKVAVFGFSLFLVLIIASYNIIWKINNSNLFLMIFGSCVLISDMFYMIYNFQNQLIVLDYLHFICQVSCYFFLIKYILSIEENKLLAKLNS